MLRSARLDVREDRHLGEGLVFAEGGDAGRILHMGPLVALLPVADCLRDRVGDQGRNLALEIHEVVIDAAGPLPEVRHPLLVVALGALHDGGGEESVSLLLRQQEGGRDVHVASRLEHLVLLGRRVHSVQVDGLRGGRAMARLA